VSSVFITSVSLLMRFGSLLIFTIPLGSLNVLVERIEFLLKSDFVDGVFLTDLSGLLLTGEVVGLDLDCWAYLLLVLGHILSLGWLLGQTLSLGWLLGWRPVSEVQIYLERLLL
jgi:hypothetical protein